MIFYIGIALILVCIALAIKFSPEWFIATVPVFFIFGFIVTMTPSAAEPNQVQSKTVYALSEVVDGHYLVGTGTPSARSYTFIGETKEGEILSDSVEAAYVEIQEGTGPEGALVVSDRAYHSWWLSPFTKDRSDTYTFIIPEGSVLESYSKAGA